MDVCKYIVALRHGGTLNSQPAASAPERLVKEEESCTGALGDGHVILNHSQVTLTTLELAPPLRTPTPHQRRERWSSGQI
ncbi:hypothetical protein TNCV_442831 [Trichonephila clavipes]|nr:hypothetical protein TNCV_442831 [Trichonephila clavipes]